MLSHKTLPLSSNGWNNGGSIIWMTTTNINFLRIWTHLREFRNPFKLLLAMHHTLQWAWKKFLWVLTEWKQNNYSFEEVESTSNVVNRLSFCPKKWKWIERESLLFEKINRKGSKCKWTCLKKKNELVRRNDMNIFRKESLKKGMKV